jgi:transglutaminase-like putative cysteine protease
MLLRASCELRFESVGETSIVLMLRARPGIDQRIIQDEVSVTPGWTLRHFTDVFGNLCVGLDAGPGELVIRSEIAANVAKQAAVDRSAGRTPFARLPPAALHFTLASRYCPADKLQALARDVTRGCPPGYLEVQAISDYVKERLTYRYGASNPSTDALETLQSREGVCRDFAHVAIALCRSIDIPARMVVGYLRGREPMDMHAWFEAHVGERWYTFDPSEPQLRGERIVLAHGRDAADVAFVTSYGDSLTLRTMQVSVGESAIMSVDRPALRAAG